MTAEDALHSSRIIACLTRRLGGEVVISAEDLRDEPAALSVVGTLDGFQIKVIEHTPPIDMGYLSLPADVQQAVESLASNAPAHAPSKLGGDWHRHGPLIEHSHLRGSFTHEHHPVTGAPTWPDAREHLGRLVRETWVDWASEQPDPKPSWLVGWDDLDAGQREVDMRIGKALYDAGRAAERDNIRRLANDKGATYWVRYDRADGVNASKAAPFADLLDATP